MEAPPTGSVTIQTPKVLEEQRRRTILQLPVLPMRVVQELGGEWVEG